MDLAGSRMRMNRDGDKITYSFDDKGTGRECGTCTLCCKLLPVKRLGKAAGERCTHAKHGKGCAIYARRPMDCKTWSCGWLADPETAGLHRPDRAHYVIDMVEDYVTIAPEDGGKPTHVPVIQIWIDPIFPEAKDDKALRAYMERMAVKHGVAFLVRSNSRDATVIIPPALNAAGVWHEQGGLCMDRDAEEYRAEVRAERAACQVPE